MSDNYRLFATCGNVVYLELARFFTVKQSTEFQTFHGNQLIGTPFTSLIDVTLLQDSLQSTIEKNISISYGNKPISRNRMK